jgi:ketosteroid isomerase-like protein
MSQEKVELMRRTFERWKAGEREVDRDIAHPDVVVRSAMTNAENHGYDGLRSWMAEKFGDWRLSIDRFRNASGGRLLALGAVYVRGCTSGVGFDQPRALLLTLSDERLIEFGTIPDHAAALGLSE